MSFIDALAEHLRPWLEFDESDHPRDSDGKFTSGDSGGGTTKDDPAAAGRNAETVFKAFTKAGAGRMIPGKEAITAKAASAEAVGARMRISKAELDAPAEDHFSEATERAQYMLNSVNANDNIYTGYIDRLDATTREYGQLSDFRWRARELDQSEKDTLNAALHNWNREPGIHDAAGLIEVVRENSPLDLSAERGFASMFMDRWADSASDSSVASIAMQINAAEVLGRDTDMLLAHYVEGSGTPIEDTESARAFAAKEAPIAQEYVRAARDLTTEKFAEIGLGPTDKVALFRGVSSTQPLEPTQSAFETNPLSSWTVFKNTADDASTWFDGAYSYVLRAEVPVADIAMTALTGSGCLDEFEVIASLAPDQAIQVAEPISSDAIEAWTQ